MTELVVVVVTVCCLLECMVLEYLVSSGFDGSWVMVLEGIVVYVNILVLAVRVIF